MQAELLTADGESLLVEVRVPPPPTLVLLDHPTVRAAEVGTGLVLGFPRRTFRLRAWTPDRPPVYDEIAPDAPESP